MKKLILILGMLSCFLFSKKTEAQIDSFFTNNVSEYDSSGVFHFYANKIEPGDLFSTYHYYFFDDTLNNMDTLSIWTDSLLHYTHYKYQQTYKGIKIEGAEFIEHATGGYTKYANGKIAMFADEVIPPDSLSDSIAFDSLSKYLNYFAGHIPTWTDSTWQQDIRITKGDSSATYYPKGKLMWALDSFNGLDFMIPRSRYRLAWRYEITFVGDSGFNKMYYVDAYSGEVFRDMDLGYYDGPANVTYLTGTKTIDTHHRGFPNFDNILLTDYYWGRVLHTKYYSPHLAWFLTGNVISFNDLWYSSYTKATDVHYAASRAYQYFNAVYKRYSMDNYGSVVRIHANWDVPSNAKYSSANGIDQLYFGSDGSKYLGTIDIVGHEYMHGITNHTAGLVPIDQPGALGESFSDIMGEMFERWEKGTNDWIVGNDLGSSVDGKYLRRSLADPSSLGEHIASCSTCNGYEYPGQPNCYKDWGWFQYAAKDHYGQGDGRSGGVHINNGVQNYWFYLLSQGSGGNKTNGKLYTYNIIGIGADKASLIAYYTVTNHLISTSQYVDARDLSITAAINLFGACSFEVIQTVNAWAAVGVGPPTGCPYAAYINELEINKPKLFPNPANNSFNIQFSTDNNYNISIFASDGKLVKSLKSINNQNSNISIEEIAAGFYYINVSNDKGNVCLKLIKQ